ncbi:MULTISPECIES: metal-sulfur cluster assembly factor [unclassified Rhizobium]|uniref:metal-sulfur cluster assembly factor n=1 Tax=unclassified Rhizobium TaxID=2613769 RepID=UPI000CDF4D6C|nr:MULTISPECIES: metal-sulfur cluster assembly factor [Rhizobium]AVA26333.1 hypothetical protein NXC24_PC01907 [Rhizobium sp. NXC24]UWU23993.1 metal-sulfur cluster assembly factor [Rhizobium tropici]
MSQAGTITIPAVVQCLRGIEDPEIGIDIVELGLIYLIEILPIGTVRIVMTTTTKACPASAFIIDAVRERLQAIESIGKVEIDLVHEPPWSPDMIGKAVIDRLPASSCAEI